MTNTDDERLSPEEHFGRAVRALREERGWTQAELAQRMEQGTRTTYTQSTVAKTEAGTRPIRLNEAMNFSFLFRRDLALMARQPGPYNELTEQLRTIRGKIRDLDRQGKDLRVERADLEAQADELAIRIEYLEQREGAGGDG